VLLVSCFGLFDVPALQAFESHLFRLQIESGRHDHAHVALDAARHAIRLDSEGSRNNVHALYLALCIIWRYPVDYHP
jgi:hypothetical protein